MATGKSGYFELSGSKGVTVRVDWAETYTVESNQSTVSITSIRVKSSSYYGVTYYPTGTISINGKTVTTMNSRTPTHNVTLNSLNTYATLHGTLGSLAGITHNEDGSKSITIAVKITGYTVSGSAGSGWSASGSRSISLTTIARASQPSLVTWPESTANVGNFGAGFSIHMNRHSDSFTHTVRYEYGSRKGTIATNVGTGTTWAVPLEFMNDIPAAVQGSGRIYVDTYNGSTLIGTKYTGFTATVPASVKPTCAVTLEDTTGVDDIYGSPVQGLSRIKVTVAGTPAYSSPIASYSISINGEKHTAATSTSGVLTASGASPVVVTVTDKRGRTSAAWSYDMTVLAYEQPAINALSVHRCDADGTENDQGNYIRVNFAAKVTSLSGKNLATYTLSYKQTAQTEYTTVTLSAYANNYAPTNGQYIFEADSAHSYDVVLTVADRHFSTSLRTNASTAFSLMDWHPSGTGIRFGGVSELENTLQNDLSLRQVGNSYAFQPEAFNGAKGYTLLAVITLTTLNVNAPIVFEINRRGALCPMWVYVRFASSSATTDPELGSITYEGDNYGAFLVKEKESTWKLYVDNTSGGSDPCLQSWYTTENQKAQLAVAFRNEQVEGTEPNVLGTYYRATPAKMQSLVDFLYPVGSICFLYSHVSPAELFGGTWTRLENRFLWATTSGGTIGATGGASTHTLTVNEIPSHRHSSNARRFTSSTSGPVGMRSASYSHDYDELSYTAYTGGGAAHNNMPPYIQVSAWRRTA